ncbi:MAG: amidohydrolase family protein [Chloroflexi bacterium]|nr:amidohydrolase family protein [Chloroflexota bacterium]
MDLCYSKKAFPWQALTAATKNAAEMCGVGPVLGTVEPGKLADLIVVDGNPLAEIENLRKLQLVLKEGRVVADHRGYGVGQRDGSRRGHGNPPNPPLDERETFVRRLPPWLPTLIICRTR